jgi:hypothetical protein
MRLLTVSWRLLPDPGPVHLLRHPALGPIVCVSIQVPSLSEASRLYQKWFGYREVTRGRFQPSNMRRWGLNKLANQAWRYLAPPGPPGPGGIRLISGGGRASVNRPLTTIGWAAAELSVQDVDGIAKRLATSPFQIIGEPRPLGSNPAIKAMQIAGPWGEVFYLTDVRTYQGGLQLVKARHDFDRTFIMVLASRSFENTRRWYERHFHLSRVSDHAVNIPVLNRSFGLPLETEYRIGSLQLSGSCLVEIDQYPDAADEKPRKLHELTSGVAIVSLLADTKKRRESDRVYLACLLSGSGTLMAGENQELLEIVR